MPASYHHSSRGRKLSDAPDVIPTETVEEPDHADRLAAYWLPIPAGGVAYLLFRRRYDPSPGNTTEARDAVASSTSDDSGEP